MNRSILQRIAAVMLAGVVLSGCATGPRAQKRTVQRTGHKPDPTTAQDGEEFSEAAMDRRVEALASFAAGIGAELNDDDGAAQKFYLKSAAADPGHAVLVVELARRFLQNKQADKAIAFLTEITSSPQATGEMFAWLALAYNEAGKTDQAIKANLTAIRLEPQLIMPYRNLSDIYQQTRRPGEALRVLDQAARQQSVNAGFWVELGELFAHYDQLHPDESKQIKPKVIAALDRASALKPQELLLIQKLADGYRLMGELSKAEGYYLALLDRFPALPGLREKLADIYLRTGQKDKAALQLQAISRDNPGNEQACFLLGNIAYEEKRFTDAADYYRKTLVLKPEFEPVYYRLAELQISSNKPREALELLRKAREKFKSNFALEFLTAAAHARAKEFGEAVKHYTGAEVIARAGEPDRLTGIFYFQFGAALERNGDFAEAVKCFRKCLDLSPNFAEAMNYLGYMWAERGENLEEARKLIGKALKLEPENAAYLDSMGWVLFKLREPREALGWLEKAIQKTEEPDPALYDHLGDIYAGLKQVAKARAAWRKSLELEPNDAVKRKLEVPANDPRTTE